MDRRDRRLTMRAVAVLTAVVALLPVPASAAASNDDARNATAVAALPFTDALDTTGATVEPGEDTSACAPSGATVWYRLDPIDVPTVISTEASDYDTVVTVREGATPEGAVVTACNDDAIGRQSRIVLQSSADAIYLQVGGWGGATGVLHLTIAHAGVIGGVVTAPNLEPAEAACVEVAAAASIAGADVTDADGTFEIGGLMPGTYRVRVVECIRRRRFAETWFGGSDRNTASPVTVSPNATTSLAVVVAPLPTGTISGRVVGPGANPQPLHACVTTYWKGDAASRTWTDADGRYETPALEQEAYLLRFDDRCGLDRLEDEERVPVGPPVWPRWHGALDEDENYHRTHVTVIGGATITADTVLFVKMEYADLVLGPLTVADPTTTTGPQRVFVPISNKGTAASKPGEMTITMCPHRPIWILTEDCSGETFALASIAAGAERTETIEWTKARYVGRVDLQVIVWTNNEWASIRRRIGSGYFVADVPGVGTCLPTCS